MEKRDAQILRFKIRWHYEAFKREFYGYSRISSSTHFLVYLSLTLLMTLLMTLTPLDDISCTNFFLVIRGFLFTVLTNFEQARRFIFFGSPVLVFWLCCIVHSKFREKNVHMHISFGVI